MPSFRDGATVSVDTLEVRSSTTTTAGIGATDASGVAVVEYGSDVMHRTVLTLTDVDVALTDEAGVVAYGGVKLYDFPEGFILFHGARLSATITKDAAGVDDDFNGDIAVGLGAADGNATLTGSEAGIIPSTALTEAVSGSTTVAAISTASQGGSIYDGSATAGDLYLNILIDDADHDVTTTPTNMTISGTLEVLWTQLGDD